MVAIAYRMLGSASEAEDIVQEAFLRFHRETAAGTEVESPKAYLSAVTTRLSIDHLRSARVRREQYVGTWLPEPLLTEEEAARRRASPAETADSLSMALPRAAREPVAGRARRVPAPRGLRLRLRGHRGDRRQDRGQLPADRRPRPSARRGQTAAVRGLARPEGGARAAVLRRDPRAGTSRPGRAARGRRGRLRRRRWRGRGVPAPGRRTRQGRAPVPRAGRARRRLEVTGFLSVRSTASRARCSSAPTVAPRWSSRSTSRTTRSRRCARSPTRTSSATSARSRSAERPDRGSRTAWCT